MHKSPQSSNNNVNAISKCEVHIIHVIDMYTDKRYMNTFVSKL